MDGFRLLTSDMGNVPTTSWIKADLCGIANFGTLQALMQPGSWCFQTTVQAMP